jgi:hypothetical protein
MVAQVHEEQVAVVTLAVDPAREPDRLTDVAETQLGAIVGTIGVHRQGDLSAANVMEKVAPRFTGANLFVNPRGAR